MMRREFHRTVMKRRKKPSMVGGSVLRPDTAIGDALRAAAREIIAAADRAMADPALGDAEAVHEIRRALKRWRALLRLLADFLGEQGVQLRSEARELMRVLSRARDAQSAIDAFDDLKKADGALSQASIATIEGRLDELRRAAETKGLTPAIRARLHRYLDFAVLSIDRWPLDRIDFTAVAEGLTLTYRRARNLIPKAWPDAEADELHNLRRRVIEHRHQMDLIEPLWPRLGQVWSGEAQRLRNRLGACQDLTVFAALIEPNRPLAPWRSRLAPAIAARRAAHVAAAARLAGRLFAERPKAFRKRIEAMWSRGIDAADTHKDIEAVTAHPAPQLDKLAHSAKRRGKKKPKRAGKPRRTKKKTRPKRISRARLSTRPRKPARAGKSARRLLRRPMPARRPLRSNRPVPRRRPLRQPRARRSRRY